ncbi:uncharacterized protein LOC115628924 [Scaptodrosophila lebanonensis]|uniref:Uncharacterized protein LOC115628923 n=1 Tax=Drosophila lebanonensis TaxID=7225 RepID=A0A6J2TWY5_DROLE|nr:uncharacterized protein LOC115628923 [Scaptodrosophila lebanonensis]XP_030381046.1 uncharacterized protein LOC115628924 [Scaptodrosophila lebanonensis]
MNNHWLYTSNGPSSIVLKKFKHKERVVVAIIREVPRLSNNNHLEYCWSSLSDTSRIITELGRVLDGVADLDTLTELQKKKKIFIADVNVTLGVKAVEETLKQDIKKHCESNAVSLMVVVKYGDHEIAEEEFERQAAPRLQTASNQEAGNNSSDY